MDDVSKYAASPGPFPTDMAHGPDTVTPSGPTRLGDAFVNIPSFEEMLVNGNVRLGKEGDSEAYTGWVGKGRLPAKLDDACYRCTINLWLSNITPFQSKIDWVNPY